MATAPGFHHPVRIHSVLTIGVAKLRVTHADLTEAALTQTLTFNSLATGNGEALLPAKARIRGCWVNIITPFSGGGSASVAVEVGDAGNVDELIESLSVFTGASGLHFEDGALTPGSYEAAYAPLVTFTADVNVVLLTAGVLEVCIHYEEIDSDSVTS